MTRTTLTLRIALALLAIPGCTAAQMPAARARSLVVATLPDSTFWPEGVDYDPRSGRYYVASVRHRTIAEVTPGGDARELIERGRPELGAIMGVRVDTTRGVLWATTSGLPVTDGYEPGDSAIAALLRIRIADGAIERRWEIPPTGRARALGDLAVGPAGDVFVSDSREPVVFRLRAGSDSLERIADPIFRSLQGLAPSADGRTLYLADYSRGLLRVDLATGRVTRLDPEGAVSRGCDGIVLTAAGEIVAVQNGGSPARIVRFTLDAAGMAIVRTETIDQNPAVADEPTIGTLAGGDFVYVANSQWEKHDAAGRRLPERPLTAPVLLAVPLGERAPER